ncbi:hypothetical protein TNCT_63161 [Trichonephila clavata]|uniref:Uncharacterized protein n=1 Tax=Trichonephila clavata TaxID=2740835 RepID=A0A8X6H5W1_TRICU|nr:hypothetical protein TNCT_63161 [Trichonephila clavata]
MRKKDIRRGFGCVHLKSGVHRCMSDYIRFTIKSGGLNGNDETQLVILKTKCASPTIVWRGNVLKLNQIFINVEMMDLVRMEVENPFSNLHTHVENS